MQGFVFIFMYFVEKLNKNHVGLEEESKVGQCKKRLKKLER